MNNKLEQEIVNYYKDYLVRRELDIDDILSNINVINDIRKIEILTSTNLDKLENLSLEYKLYDSNYEEFIISMGTFAIGINKCSDMDISTKDIRHFINNFLDLHDKFEDLSQRNIMKDAYVWK